MPSVNMNYVIKIDELYRERNSLGTITWKRHCVLTSDPSQNVSIEWSALFHFPLHSSPKRQDNSTSPLLLVVLSKDFHSALEDFINSSCEIQDFPRTPVFHRGETSRLWVDVGKSEAKRNATVLNGIDWRRRELESLAFEYLSSVKVQEKKALTAETIKWCIVMERWAGCRSCLKRDPRTAPCTVDPLSVIWKHVTDELESGSKHHAACKLRWKWCTATAVSSLIPLLYHFILLS